MPIEQLELENIMQDDSKEDAEKDIEIKDEPVASSSPTGAQSISDSMDFGRAHQEEKS